METREPQEEVERNVFDVTMLAFCTGTAKEKLRVVLTMRSLTMIRNYRSNTIHHSINKSLQIAPLMVLIKKPLTVSAGARERTHPASE
ncbi:hypothetical protein SK128_022249, partial [Halocaridina rubra]